MRALARSPRMLGKGWLRAAPIEKGKVPLVPLICPDTAGHLTQAVWNMGPVWFGGKTEGRGNGTVIPLKKTKGHHVSFQGSGTAHFLRRSLSPGHSCAQGWGLAQGRPTSEGQVGLLILANLITPVLAGMMGTCPTLLGSQITLERRPRTKNTEAQRPRSLSAGMTHTPPPHQETVLLAVCMPSLIKN